MEQPTENLTGPPGELKSVQQAMGQLGLTSGQQPKAGNLRRWLILVIVLAIYVALAGMLQFLQTNQFGMSASQTETVVKVLSAALSASFCLLVAWFVDVTFVTIVRDDAARYNVRRILWLLASLAVGIVVLSSLLSNWYTALVSFGVVSIILSLAFQSTLTSVIAWVYLLIRSPYRVGDRIRIGDYAGDVIDVSYLDTTLWEIGGQYLSTDHPSGRVIRFPNSMVLDSMVINYSWPLFPYIWNEIKLAIAYESDLDFVAETMEQIAREELGETMMKRVLQYRDLLADTPVDEVLVQEKPVVLYRPHDNTWIEAICRYLVHPKEAGPVKTRLIKKMLAALNAAPDKAMFPKSNMR